MFPLLGVFPQVWMHNDSDQKAYPETLMLIFKSRKDTLVRKIS